MKCSDCNEELMNFEDIRYPYCKTHKLFFCSDSELYQHYKDNNEIAH